MLAGREDGSPAVAPPLHRAIRAILAIRAASRY
jgi:hypothetical protein